MKLKLKQHKNVPQSLRHEAKEMDENSFHFYYFFKAFDFKKGGSFKIEHFKGMNHYLHIVSKIIHFHGLLTAKESFFLIINY